MGLSGSKRATTTVLKNCTLWKADRSPACRAVLMALDALNLNVTEVDVDMDKSEHRAPELTAMNSLQTLPILRDNDWVISDSHAISSYLVNRYAGPGYLLPLDTGSQALIDQLMHYNSGVLHPKYRSAAYPILYDDCRYVMPHHVVEIEHSYADLENMLAGRSWFNSSPWPMLSDICICATISTLNVMVPIDKKRYPKLSNWLYRMTGEMFYLTANAKGLDEFAKKIDAGRLSGNKTERFKFSGSSNRRRSFNKTQKNVKGAKMQQKQLSKALYKSGYSSQGDFVAPQNQWIQFQKVQNHAVESPPNKQENAEDTKPERKTDNKNPGSSDVVLPATQTSPPDNAVNQSNRFS